MQNADGISDRLDGAVSFREPLGQTKVMRIRQSAITHEVCLAAQFLVGILEETMTSYIHS